MLSNGLLSVPGMLLYGDAQSIDRIARFLDALAKAAFLGSDETARAVFAALVGLEPRQSPAGSALVKS